MKPSDKAQTIFNQLSESTKLGDLRVIAKEIKTNHALAMELWNSGRCYPQLLALLIMDKKQLSPDLIDGLFTAMELHASNERLQLADWFLANQLTKDKKTIALLESWANSSVALKRRLYWYYQGRLRWTGQTPPPNTPDLLSEIQKKIMTEVPEVQWAMNFTAAWIGIFDKPYREQCLKMGETLGLYKDEMVPRNCTPNYLPLFIAQEVTKRKL